MVSKRFHTRRQRHNTTFVAVIIPVVLLVGVLVFALTGQLIIPLGLLGLSLVALLIAWLRDAGDQAMYELRDGVLALRSGRDVLEIPMSEVLDVSLIDRTGARAYVHGLIHQEEGFRGPQLRERMREITRFCTVDIGLVSFTMGVGRYFIDRLPKAKHDLVLLRLKDGRAYLLSPVYNQDLISMVTRAQAR